MVLSSVSPLFVLWAIRGNSLIPDPYFIGFCLFMIVVPNAFLWLRMHTAMKLRELRELTVGRADDHRDHILVYLFAMLLPFYAVGLGNWRDLWATLVALGFIVFLFWHLNLHYMNIFFALKGYRVFTIYAPTDDNPISSKASLVLVTRRSTVSSGQRLAAFRLSDTVYWDKDE